jgi:hypothetical protein
MELNPDRPDREIQGSLDRVAIDCDRRGGEVSLSDIEPQGD